MNGIEAMQKIKEINSNIPVIAVTAFALKHEKAELMSKGFNDYLSKPLDLKKLEEVIIKNLV